MSTALPTGTSGSDLVNRPTATPVAVSREEPRRRGRLIMPERVIEKIAGQAASEVAQASGRSGGVLGFGAVPDGSARPRVEVDLSAESADLSIKVGVAYPGSIRAATQQIRDHVTQRVEQLTGVDVRRVDIDVMFLSTGVDERRRGRLR